MVNNRMHRSMFGLKNLSDYKNFVLICANRAGEDNGVRYGGGSCIVHFQSQTVLARINQTSNRTACAKFQI